MNCKTQGSTCRLKFWDVKSYIFGWQRRFLEKLWSYIVYILDYAHYSLLTKKWSYLGLRSITCILEKKDQATFVDRPRQIENKNTALHSSWSWICRLNFVVKRHTNGKPIFQQISLFVKNGHQHIFQKRTLRFPPYRTCSAGALRDKHLQILGNLFTELVFGLP